MSHSTSADNEITAPVVSELGLPPEVTARNRSSPRRRTRQRFWWLLAVTLVISGLSYPPPWHFLVRGFLVHLAARHGCELSIGRMEGGPFDPIHLYDVRCHRRGFSDGPADTGADLRVAHAEWTLAWRLPWWRQPPPSDVRRLVLDGVSGRWDFAQVPGPADPAVPGHSAPGRWLDRMAARLVPTNFFVRGEDLTLQRNRYRLRVRGLRLSGERDSGGALLVREVEIAGPGFENTLLNRQGRTLWEGNRFSLKGLDFGPGVRLLNATLDGAHLRQHRLDWECTLTAMGGEVRGQGAINFVHPRLALEVAGSLRRMPVAPLARLLGLAGPAGGQVDQGSFSFRGDPENWTAAEMWLAVQATNFRWGQRDWQNLELRATVLHRRIQVHRLELQQSLNRVSLTGECPLCSPGEVAGRWWEAGFSCHVDARLDDLHALTQLFGARLPALAGRMSVNGTLEAMPGHPGIDGYLNVEGSRMNVRGAPLDYLHSTLLFRGNELSVADVQATHGEDYFAGRGSVNLAGASGYQGELRLALADAGDYAPVLAGIVDLATTLPTDGLRSPVRLEGVFYGPDPAGKTVFLTFGALGQGPVSAPTGGDWWGDHWLGLTSWPARAMPTVELWQ